MPLHHPPLPVIFFVVSTSSNIRSSRGSVALTASVENPSLLTARLRNILPTGIPEVVHPEDDFRTEEENPRNVSAVRAEGLILRLLFILLRQQKHLHTDCVESEHCMELNCGHKVDRREAIVNLLQSTDVIKVNVCPTENGASAHLASASFLPSSSVLQWILSPNPVGTKNRCRIYTQQGGTAHVTSHPHNRVLLFAASDKVKREKNTMNQEKLAKLQAQVRIGGKGTARRKRKVVHKTATADDKKLQGSLKKLAVNNIAGIEEVNMIRDDGTVIHFNNPKVQASLSANTFAITGHAETKQLTEMLPGILSQLGADSLSSLRKLAEQFPRQSMELKAVKEENAEEDDDDVPDLQRSFPLVGKLFKRDGAVVPPRAAHTTSPPAQTGPTCPCSCCGWTRSRERGCGEQQQPELPGSSLAENWHHNRNIESLGGRDPLHNYGRITAVLFE
ncbi:hypothetical protein CCH79_00009678 [Gambusia affinis]|uniref:Transcription factor BTF3 n=1 Tax=Gambusia affinis TaxID=33528 RepID=A0A315W399_GAMAF|nr:hypothetical protein CCH79_00009678 [Gambusia affinis]